MPDTPTPDQVVAAAQELDQDEFTRANLAKQMGSSWEEIKPAFREARKAGHFEKASEDESGRRRFRLTGQA
jgi:hypothetical protein